MQLIQKAVDIADQAWSEMLQLVKHGIIEKELALELEFIMRRLGAEGRSFDTIVASGFRGALPHGVASDRVIQPGDMVTIDFGA
ncbi:M24 family metallopeptidase, partial [Dehalococcoidales bacterium]|nr:M24 family metallopeptidase [Dehalococcoidales bacterium]MCL0091602.1 M24 family metallopeptidase [Dehalococcoidales bacterium]